MAPVQHDTDVIPSLVAEPNDHLLSGQVETERAESRETGGGEVAIREHLAEQHGLSISATFFPPLRLQPIAAEQAAGWRVFTSEHVAAFGSGPFTYLCSRDGAVLARDAELLGFWRAAVRCPACGGLCVLPR